MSAKANIFLGTPCYGGWLSEDYFHSILDLQNFCRQEEISLRIQTLGSESLITRARNTIVANFLDNKDATHLLFIDADIGFEAKLVKENKDYKNLCHPYVLNFLDKDNINVEKGFAEVLDAATGFMLIKRSCIEKMVKEYPDLHYVTDQIINGKEYDSKNTYLFFDTMKDENGRYLSEDYAFSRRWQKIGGTIWADLSSELIHYGQYKFQGQLWKHFDKKT